ncbi:MAG TPA: hypothetical protein VG455_08845 [Acidimicrobiales bacterium]|nr:hypothetical protein [Acidimicrobiales bacterium]
MLVTAALLLLAPAAPSVADAVSGAVRQAFCAISGAGSCAPRPSFANLSPSARAAALAEAERRSAPFVDRYGGRFGQLADAARAAREAGDYEEAKRLQDLIDHYSRLVGSGPRGELVVDLAGPRAREFADLVGQGTIAGPGGRTNRRYFQVQPSPGGGLLVMDFFIRTPTSGGLLEGDDREFQDPLLSGLPLDKSRVIILLDRDTGRGTIVQTETCTRSAFGRTFCNEPRPIVLDMGTLLVNDRANDVTGEGVNLDVPNQLEVATDDDSITLRYDALNSITPLGISVDGTFTLRRDLDGRYRLVEEDRDDYPAIGLYQYRPSDPRTHVIDEDPGTGVLPGALPRCDLPDLPGPLPDLPTLPGPC